MRCIDADKLYPDCMTKNGTLAISQTQIANAPTVSDRPQGEWINSYPEIEKNPMFNYGICSLCKFEQSMSNKLNFCPNCGADMRGENGAML